MHGEKLDTKLGKVSLYGQKGIVLGHKVSSKRIEVAKIKVEVTVKLPELKFIKDNRSFVGHVGFYKKFHQRL